MVQTFPFFFCILILFFIENWTFESNNVNSGNQILPLAQDLLVLVRLYCFWLAVSISKISMRFNFRCFQVFWYPALFPGMCSDFLISPVYAFWVFSLWCLDPKRGKDSEGGRTQIMIRSPFRFPGSRFSWRGGVCNSRRGATAAAHLCVCTSLISDENTVPWYLEDLVLIVHPGSCKLFAGSSWNTCTASCRGAGGEGDR